MHKYTIKILVASWMLLYLPAAHSNPGLISAISLLLSDSSNSPPLVEAGPDKFSTINEPVIITGTAIDGDGSIVSQQWLENSHILSKNKTFSYIPTTRGEHILIFEATDNDGATKSDTLKVIVNSPANLAPVARAGKDIVVKEGTEITFDASKSSDDKKIIAYKWNDTIKVVDKLFPNKRDTKKELFTAVLPVGIHRIELKVTDEDGLKGFDMLNITVYKKNISPNIVLEKDIQENTINRKSSFIISSNVAGILRMDGTCAAYFKNKKINANVENTITLTNLSAGNYEHCKIYLTDSQSKVSNKITLSQFSVLHVLNTTRLYGRDDGKGLDYVIIGDGFKIDEMHKFRTQAKIFADAILNYDPKIKLQRNAWNVHLVEVVSKKSGADNTKSQYGPKVDTALDAHFFCTPATLRLLCVNNNKVKFIVSQLVPQFDKILVIVNTKDRGGSGGNIAVGSLSEDGTKVVVHELGHSLAGLADEYLYIFGEGTKSEIKSEPKAPNVTANNNINTVKWKHWVGEEADIHAQPGEIKDKVGLYLGANFSKTQLWRPTNYSFMHSAGRKSEPMHQVNAEAWALAVYRFAGVYYNKYPQIPDIIQSYGSNTIFRIEPSMGSNAQKITWKVDGIKQKIRDDQFTFTYGINRTTDYKVEAIIEDKTGVIRKDTDGVSSSRIIWNIIIN